MRTFGTHALAVLTACLCAPSVFAQDTSSDDAVAAFELLDRNGDGRVERTEAAAAVASADASARDAVLKAAGLVGRWDGDGDGTVVESERPARPRSVSISPDADRAIMAEIVGAALAARGGGWPGTRVQAPPAISGAPLAWSEKHMPKPGGYWNDVPASIRVDGTPPGAPSAPVEFVVDNLGDVASGPFEVAMGGFMGVFSAAEWSIDPDSSCLTVGAPAGGSCSVLLRMTPVADSQNSAVLILPGGTDRNDSTKNLNVSAYARNVAGRLPDGVLGNGDPCPAPGSSSEIALSDTGHRGPGGTYFAGADHYSQFFVSPTKTLATSGCDAWVETEEGVRSCSNPGSGFHSSTLRIYAGPSIDGPWSVEQKTERYVSATLRCRNGLIDTVSWTW